LGQGNYAGRICEDDRGLLIWSFFSQNDLNRTTSNVLPPPKRLVRNPAGFLRVQTYEKILQRVTKTIDAKSLCPLGTDVASGRCEVIGPRTQLSGTSGFEAFVFPESEHDFRLSAKMRLSGAGKCGLVLRLDRDSRDGYYVSLDLLKGVAQLRAWGTNGVATGEHMMKFQTLQSGFWYTETPGVADLQLIAWGSYIELSIDQRVVLSLANHEYDSGAVGFYIESAEVELEKLQLDRLEPPAQSDEHLAVG
jgi:beta-fructofuranosidase